MKDYSFDFTKNMEEEAEENYIRRKVLKDTNTNNEKLTLILDEDCKPKQLIKTKDKK